MQYSNESAVMQHSNEISKICLDPLSDKLNLTALKHLMQLFKSTIGPYGNLKIIQNCVGGPITVTSSSKRLFQNLKIKNTFLKIVLSATKSQLDSYNDGGLYCAFLTLKLIDNALPLPYQKSLIGQLYETFGSMYISCLKDEPNPSIFRIDFSQLSHLQSLVQTVVKSKPGCILTEENQNHICLSLLKMFLNILPNAPYCTMNKSNITFHAVEGLCNSHSKVYDGLLIRCPEIINNSVLDNLTSHKLKSLKVVLFSISLAGDTDLLINNIEETETQTWKEVLNCLRNLMIKLINDKVNIVACQKVVHPKLQKQLEDSGILVLDRLGIEAAKNLQCVIGADSILSLSSNITYGSISSLKRIVVGNKVFLIACNSEIPFSTFLICNYNEEAINETKVVCQQALSSLFQLLEKSSVCFGGGCTEMFVMKTMQKKVNSTISEITTEVGCSISQVHNIFQSFLSSITDVIISIHQGSRLEFATELVHNHLWKLENSNFPVNSSKCMCGQYTADSIQPVQWKLLMDTFTDFSDDQSFTENLDSLECDVGRTVLLDELNCKSNASFVAFETAAMLLKTTVLITGSS